MEVDLGCGLVGQDIRQAPAVPNPQVIERVCSRVLLLSQQVADPPQTHLGGQSAVRMPKEMR